MANSLSRAEVREIDRRAVDDFHVPSIVLMENAGRGAADLLVSLGVEGPVAICCGKGNNGGDGLVLARHLALRGLPTIALLFAAPGELSRDAQLQWNIVQALGLRRHIFSDKVLDLSNLGLILDSADWIVDALVGTGLRGPVRAPFDALIPFINARRARVLALDLPSGLDADTGEPLGATIRADHTVTFVAPKRGFSSGTAPGWLGRVHVADIGFRLPAT